MTEFQTNLKGVAYLRETASALYGVAKEYEQVIEEMQIELVQTVALREKYSQQADDLTIQATEIEELERKLAEQSK